MSWLRALLRRWTWQMAWRESRTRRARLMLFGSSIVLGIAALIAIGAFRDGLLSAVEEQAKSLLGADLVIAGRSRFGEEEDRLLNAIGGRQSRETDLSSMILFPTRAGTRLVQVRGIEGDFPFYGALETDPPEAAATWRLSGGALVEETLLAQYGAQVGDPVKIGTLTTQVVGRLKRVPGDTLAFATLAPRVYLRSADLEKATLQQKGSLARHKCYIQLPVGVSAEQVVKPIQKDLDRLRLGHTTAEKRQEDLGNSMERLSDFLSLVGFVALFLGGVGIANAIHTHVKEKLSHVAVLRCLGATEAETFSIYLAQAITLGAVASLAGTLLGVAVQFALPHILGDFLPVKVGFKIQPAGLAQGFGIGLAFSILFALLPLLGIRKASPLIALRISTGVNAKGGIPWPEIVAGILVAGASVVFAMQHTERKAHGLYFVGGLAASFLLLWATSRALMFGLRKVVPAGLPYPWRQGLSNLYRPNNRTVLLMLSVGLGTFVLLTVHLTQNVLIKELVKEGGTNRPNTVLFDIQPDQREAVVKAVSDQGLRIMDQAPIVTMRLAKIGGKSVEDILTSTNRQIAKWALRREYRCTWRETLANSESLVSGVWHPAFDAAREPAPVSVEEGIARDLGLKIGDELAFDLQGIPLTTRVASLRKVDWRRVQPNFFVVFPPGVLESAPAFHVVVTRSDSSGQSATLQRSIVERFPNISVIDLSLVLSTLDTLLGKISLGIQFMAFFTVATGVLVLAGAVLVSRKQRVREGALLRTLGASRAQIRTILAAEYGSLGLMAALVATVLAVGASWGLAHFVFKTAYVWSPAPLVAAWLGVPVITLITGWWSSRSVVDAPPLETLREEG